MPGIVEKIVPSPRPSEPEKAQIAVDGSRHRVCNFRTDSTSTDENGDGVRLKKGAHVEVTVTAETKSVNSPQLTKTANRLGVRQSAWA